MYDQLRLDNQLCFRFYTVSRLLVQAYKPLLEPLGLSYSEYLVMMVLWEKDNQLVGDIVRRVGLDTNSLTPLLKRMEAQGLILRTRGVADGRRTLVTLTRQGRELEEQAKDVPACMMKCWRENPPSNDELMQMMTLVDKLIQSLKQ